MSRQITLYKEDLNPSSILTWEGLLEDLGIESHVLVAGREIDKEIDAVTIFVSGAIGNDDVTDVTIPAPINILV